MQEADLEAEKEDLEGAEDEEDVEWTYKMEASSVLPIKPGLSIL